MPGEYANIDLFSRLAGQRPPSVVVAEQVSDTACPACVVNGWPTIGPRSAEETHETPRSDTEVDRKDDCARRRSSMPLKFDDSGIVAVANESASKTTEAGRRQNVGSFPDYLLELVSRSHGIRTSGRPASDLGASSQSLARCRGGSSRNPGFAGFHPWTASQTCRFHDAEALAAPVLSDQPGDEPVTIGGNSYTPLPR
jgi:hypothetical protein